ncbi:hypothetical protein N7516_004396 [Penicillium verrucosum]|uniref:uncharacterized protein n=1 Tax=Penicillium verrucosum TaxID=60171 RepID=UPI0025451E3B|nr:uncharacterized protein N7516_004396 [Penicillium verrucosum]KAJ5944228.1 hypothetical protein N7516_004396 [Penicillium verrucosum]
MTATQTTRRLGRDVKIPRSQTEGGNPVRRPLRSRISRSGTQYQKDGRRKKGKKAKAHAEPGSVEYPKLAFFPFQQAATEELKT